jgi:hypothetical protein
MAPTLGGTSKNGLEVSLWGGTSSIQYSIKDVTKTYYSGKHLKVRTDQETTQSAQFKLMAGTYYVQGYEWTSNINGYGNVTVTAQAQTSDRESNNTKLLATSIGLNTQYRGLINWWLPLEEVVSRHTEDWYDYYKFVVPSNGYGIRLTFSRPADGISRKIEASVLSDTNTVSNGTISLRDVYSSSRVWTLAKGTYYVYINGWNAEYGDATEYNFKLTSENKKLTKIALNKTKLSLKKGKKFTLKVKAWTPKDVSTQYKKLKFKSSNKKIASVSSKGVIKAKKKVRQKSPLLQATERNTPAKSL